MIVDMKNIKTRLALWTFLSAMIFGCADSSRNQTSSTTTAIDRYEMAKNEAQSTNKIYLSQGKPVRFVTKYCSVNSAGGADPFFSFYNTSEKTIKYFTFYLTFYNGVGDPAICSIKGTSSVGAKITGPIFPNKLGHGRFDPMIYNPTAKDYEVTSLKIEYMDGTKKSYTKSQIDKFGKQGWNSKQSYLANGF